MTLFPQYSSGVSTIDSPGGKVLVSAGALATLISLIPAGIKIGKALTEQSPAAKTAGFVDAFQSLTKVK